MPHLSPATPTAAEQRGLLAVTAACPPDHTVFSLALGTGLRLGEIVGLNVGDVFFDDGTPRIRRGDVREAPEDGVLKGRSDSAIDLSGSTRYTPGAARR